MPSSQLPKLPSRDEVSKRRNFLMKVIEDAKNRGDLINENYLLYHMKMEGFTDYNRSKLYNDRLELDSQNNYIRTFLPRYSRFQEDIINELDAIKDEATALSERDWGIKRVIQKETKDGLLRTVIVEEDNYKPKAEFLKIRAKVAELKQKHGEGQNIQISAVIVQRELATKKAELSQLRAENSILKVTSTKEDK